MSLTDLMSGFRLEVWAELAMLIFMGVFVAVAVRTFATRTEEELDEVRRLPFDENQAPTRESVR